MKRILLFTLLIGGTILFGPSEGISAGPPPVGGMLPEWTLDVPKDGAEKTYLGLSGAGVFKIPQIRAKTVIIEILSMYCPYCQADAPKTVELYQKIAASPKLKSQIKIIGVGVGNTPFELKIFRDKYQIPFPLIEDGAFVVHERFGKTRTPLFVAAKLNKDGSTKVIYSKVGTMEDPGKFLDLLVDKAGLK